MNWLAWVLMNKVEKEDYRKAKNQAEWFEAKAQGYDQYFIHYKDVGHRRNCPDVLFCPHFVGSKSYDAWIAGWLAAEEELEIKNNTITLQPAFDELDWKLELSELNMTFSEWLGYFCIREQKKIYGLI